jgi:hypothetical protein
MVVPCAGVCRWAPKRRLGSYLAGTKVFVPIVLESISLTQSSIRLIFHSAHQRWGDTRTALYVQHSPSRS